MPDNAYLYTLAAKSLQSYILHGDKLRLMVGASELIEELPQGFLSELLSGCGFGKDKHYTVLSRAAGSARLLFFDEAFAHILARVLPLAISRYAPGLDVVQDVRMVEGGLGATLSAAERQLSVRRNLPAPAYPVAGPLVDRAPRSGFPAVGTLTYGADPEPADAAMLAKAGKIGQAHSGLLKKMLGDLLEERKSPTNLEELVSEREYLALLHADANGLGQLVMTFLNQLSDCSLDDAAKQYTSFSTAVATATVNALREALAPLVPMESTGMLPFRPLVCAGDDITLILRGQDAVGVVERYLEAFERTSAEAFTATKVACLTGQHLTAAAGVAFIHKNFPFAQAYALCESLCKYAKNTTGREGSSFAFWRVTSTMADEFTTILDRELITPHACLTRMPYRVGGQADPQLADLLTLARAMKTMPRGSLRGVITALYENQTAAEQAYARILDVASARSTPRCQAALKAFTAAMDTLTSGPSSLWMKREGNIVSTPLYDASELLAATNNAL